MDSWRTPSVTTLLQPSPKHRLEVAMQQPEPAAAQEAVSSPARYTAMWYKNTAAVGVRKSGGKQLFQIRVAGATREEQTNVAARLIGKLEQGTDFDTVKAWLAEEKAALQRALGHAPNVW